MPLAFVSLAATALLSDWIGPGHQYAGMLALAGWFFLARQLGPRGWRIVWGALLSSSVAVAALAIEQIWFMPRSRGPFSSPNILGAAAVLMAFAAMARGSLACVGANLAALGLSQSRGAILALGVGCFVLLVKRGTGIGIAALIMAGAAAISIRPGFEEARLGIWHIAWQAAMLRPLTGYGQGGLWIAGLSQFYSVPLEWLLATGILGLAAAAWLFIAAWRRSPPIFRAFLAAWLVQGLFLFGTWATYFLLITALAWVASEARDKSNIAGRVDDDEPFLDRGMRADRPE